MSIRRSLFIAAATCVACGACSSGTPEEESGSSSETVAPTASVSPGPVSPVASSSPTQGQGPTGEAATTSPTSQSPPSAGMPSDEPATSEPAPPTVPSDNVNGNPDNTDAMPEPDMSTPGQSGPVQPDPTATSTVSEPTAPTGSCEFTISQSLSEKIPTVGIVEWSVATGAVESAEIEFGRDASNYEYTAPVDLAEPQLRTLLLGMKAETEYNFRIVATVDGESCTSANQTLQTGGLATALSIPTITTPIPEELSQDFMVSGRWGNNNDGPAFIMDADGDYVWWYPAPDDVIRARMTYDGKAMWIRNTGQAEGSGAVLRVSMDGLEEERWDLGMTTHDLAVMPDGRVGLTAWDGDGCAEILIFDPSDGSTSTIFNARDAHGQDSCHVNNLQYYAEDDTFTFSDYNADSYVKITSAGELVWVLNGAASDFTGTDWSRQHGLHILSANHLLIFSNGSGLGANSMVYEYQLDPEAGTAVELWSYDGGTSAPFGGDVQRLSNGNTLIVYSSAGVVQEVNADKELLREMVWEVGNTVSYAMKRPTLYGPPPKVWRFDDEP